jgi:hypothetical protein
MEELQQLFVRYNYPNKTKFRAILKGLNIKAAGKDIDAVVSNNAVVQVHKQIVTSRDKQYYITAMEPLETMQMDLLDYQKYATTNANYKYILIVVDVFSRYAFAKCIKSKTPDEVLRAFKTFHIVPNSVHHDSGNEWKGVFLQWMHEKNAFDFTSEIGNHNALGVIDRFSKTLKQIISRYMTANNSTTYYQQLDSFIEHYNLTPHVSLGNVTPKNAATVFEDYKKVKDINSAKIQFNKELQAEEQKTVKVGDYVRVKVNKKLFRKGYEITYSPDVFQIASIQGAYVTLTDERRFAIRDVLVVQQDAASVDTTARTNAERGSRLQRLNNRAGIF